MLGHHPLSSSFVDPKSKNMGFSSLGVMTDMEKPYPEDKESDYISGDLSLIPYNALVFLG